MWAKLSSIAGNLRSKFPAILILFAPIGLSWMPNRPLNAQNLYEVNIEIYRNIEKTPVLTEVATDSRFVKLETNRDILIGRITKIDFVGDNLLITNSGQELLLFDSQGNFISKVGKKGRGPQEYVQIFGTAIDADNGFIYILDNGNRKILKFDFSGAFIESISNVLGCTEIEVVDGNLVMYNASARLNMNSSYHIHSANHKDEELSGFHPREMDSKIYYSRETIQNSDTGFIYWEPHWDTIYFFSGGAYMPKYHFVLGKDALPKDVILERPDIKPLTWFDDYISVSMFLESDSFLFVLIADYDRKGKLIVFEKNLSTGYYIKFDKAIGKWGFPDDISGIPIFSPDFKLSDKIVASAHEVYDLKAYQQRGLMLRKVTKNARYLELDKIIGNSEITDNPIIQIVTLK